MYNGGHDKRTVFVFLLPRDRQHSSRWLCLHFGREKERAHTRQQRPFSWGVSDFWLTDILIIFPWLFRGKRCDTLFFDLFWGGVLGHIFVGGKLRSGP